MSRSGDVLDAPVLLGLALVFLGMDWLVALLVGEAFSRTHTIDDPITGEHPLLFRLTRVGHHAKRLSTCWHSKNIIRLRYKQDRIQKI